MRHGTSKVQTRPQLLVPVSKAGSMDNLSDHDFFLISTLVDQFLSNNPLASIPFPANLQKSHLSPHEKESKFQFAHHNLKVRADVAVAVGLSRALTREEFAVISNRIKAFLKDHGY